VADAAALSRASSSSSALPVSPAFPRWAAGTRRRRRFYLGEAGHPCSLLVCASSPSISAYCPLPAPPCRL